MSTNTDVLPKVKIYKLAIVFPPGICYTEAQLLMKGTRAVDIFMQGYSVEAATKSADPFGPRASISFLLFISDKNLRIKL